jgi:transposase-like protein
VNVNLVELIEKYGSEEKCRAYLEELRWPNGPVCPRCESTSVSQIVERHQFDCNSCRYQFSVMAGTLFHDSHLPLWKWFLGIYLVCESKKGISAKQLHRMLKVSYKTAWYMSHRVREAMGDDDQPLLRGIIEADETFLGGKYRKRFRSPKEAADHRMDNKAIVVGAVKRHGEVRLRLVRDTKYKTLLGFMRDVTADEAEAIYTDSNRSYRRVGDHNTRHEWVDHKAEEWVRGDVHTQTIESVWSLLDRSIIGAFHKVSVKHLPRYLDEIEFRFNGRDNPFLFRDTLMVMLNGDALPYRELVSAN